MKIGVMHWAFPPVVGGVESHLIYLYEEMARMGYDISILTSPHVQRKNDDYPWCKIVSDDLMSIDHCLNKAGPDRYKCVHAMLEDFISSEEPDILHAHNFHHFVPDHAECLEELSRKYDLPMVLTIHNYWEDDLCRTLLKDIDWDKIVAVSYFTKSPCVFDAGVSPEKVEVHYHGVNLDNYCVRNDCGSVRSELRLSGEPIVFHPARACWSKGSLHSIRAVASLKEKYPNISLILSGNGESVDFDRERPSFQSDVGALIEQLGMEGHVMLVNASGDQMPLYMSAADVVIYPTIFPQGEAFGIAPVEAMACGKPVIVTDSGGLVESTSNGINGLIIDRDPDKLSEKLADNIDRLLTDRGYAEYLGKNGREVAIERFDSRKMALRMDGLYHRLASDRLTQKIRRMDTMVSPGTGIKGPEANGTPFRSL
jgi:glycosyltransferase involved in cell wall biosynthesis